MFDPNDPGQLSPFQFNQLLMAALADDDQRTALYQQLLARPQALAFQSAADASGLAQPPGAFSKTVQLLTARAHVEQALSDDRHFSNLPYQALGSGSFMLGLDGMPHALQRGFAARLMRYAPEQISALCAIAWQAAAVLPLKTRRFNAAELAEQAALRFAALLFGFPMADHPVLEASMRAGYHQLIYQIIGRHFSYQPQLATEAQRTGVGFLLRTGDLLAALARGDEHEDLKELRAALAAQAAQRQLPVLAQFRPVCQRLVQDEHSEYSATELSVIVGGLIAGTIGNVQAAVAITLDDMFRHGGAGALSALVAVAHAAEPGTPARAQLQQRIHQALAAHPPAAFLPRQVVHDVSLPVPGGAPLLLRAGTPVVLAMGAATLDGRRAAQRGGADAPDLSAGDPLVYGGTGGAGGAGGVHNCLGQHLAQPLVTEVVRGILRLPGLTRAIDPDTGRAATLKKTWGFRCDSLWLEHQRDQLMVQQPLAIIMKVKAPVAANVDKLKAIIGVGAPRIELRLATSRHVHFAWFLLLDNDSRLALFTTYDGGLDAYIKHFALEVGSLFDKLFDCLEDEPPLPVAQHPDEFLDVVRRHNAQPLGQYFFSAYPQASVAQIQQALDAAQAVARPAAAAGAADAAHPSQPLT